MANDHYIPQFYLRNFAITGRPAFIWSYIRNGNPKDRPISRVASADDFYTMDIATPGVDPRGIDKQLQIVETNAAPIIQYLLTAKSAALSQQDREVLAYFIALLADRTPYTRDKLKSLDAHMNVKFMEIVAHSDPMFNDVLNSVPDEDKEEFLKSRETLKEASKHIKMEYADQKGANQYFLALALGTAEAVASLLETKHWSLLEVDTSRVFVTSDNPVVLLPPEDHHPAMGLGFTHAHVLVPLSPQRCLLMGNKNAKFDIFKAKREQTIIFNERIVYAAHKHVYSNFNSKDTQRIFDTTEEGHNLKVYSS